MGLIKHHHFWPKLLRCHGWVLAIASVGLFLLFVVGVTPSPSQDLAPADVSSPSLSLTPLVPSQGETYQVLFQTALAHHSHCQESPPWYSALADSSNYGDRYGSDLTGQPLTHAPLIVLHESVSSGATTIRTFQTHHPRDEDQRSYHEYILLNGSIIHIVPWGKRAYGAGNSQFQGESVKTNPRFSASVNNFALHFSLETPPGGNHNGFSHGGYTDAQYRSLAWLVATTGLGDDRLTTHKLVDRGGERSDPRSFNFSLFKQYLSEYRRVRCHS
ncbi:peptidoglycan recognition protein family protein [Candidatus Synechococcus calcipolaris G9]|uniref:Peptidoglycan recognition protein family protein n=1 Tax=Candidatus Synechococcus calcipolaris G9 TaxID=1497997 RepID=A0ABT6EWU0_9SYNE|nr:peptidoglycan recognition family protein [Candidatus Synechococcus calcipolaris]MDG2989827.1 peptidoglycan recognition protein family protein [Candidatus Synechococcus calcipolaris G9]